MSRGYGRVQRAVLAALEKNEWAGLRQASEGLTVVDLVNRIYHRKPWPAWLMPPAERSAVRRALRMLARDGHVLRLGQLRRGDHCRWHRGLHRS